jgi:hypothetical protein
MLAVLLLAAIAWGSTVEFTHHHGAKAKSVESLSSTVPSTADNEATQISSNSTNGPTSKSRSDGECLICQLHQNLSATVIGHTPGVGPTETRGLNTLPPAVVQLSEFISTGHGRAPPSIL